MDGLPNFFSYGAREGARSSGIIFPVHSLIAHFGKEWWPGTQTKRAHLWHYLGERKCKQTWRKAKWNVSAGIKQLKIANRKVELKEKKHENMKLKEEDVPGAILPREKPEECTVKQLQRWLLCRGAKTTGKKNAARTKVSRSGLGIS